MRGGAVRRGLGVAMGAAAPLEWTRLLRAAGSTNLNETTPLVEVMFVLSMAGALLTFIILAWALWKFRDQSTKGRRYG